MNESNSRALRARKWNWSFIYAKDIENPCIEGSYILFTVFMVRGRIASGMYRQGVYEEEKLLHRILVLKRPLRVQKRKRQGSYTVL
jgi:hypothetical protein